MGIPCKNCLVKPICGGRLIEHIRKEISKYHLDRYDVIVDAAYETLCDQCPQLQKYLEKENVAKNFKEDISLMTYSKYCVLSGTKLLLAFPQIETTFEKVKDVS